MKIRNKIRAEVTHSGVTKLYRNASNRTWHRFDGFAPEIDRIVDENDAYGRGNEENARQHQGIHRLIIVYVSYHGAPDKAIQDLREGDEKVKNPHVDPHLTRRD